MSFSDALDDTHRAFIASQKMFFVATAPLSAKGHVNVSPKGQDSLVVLDERHVAYLDLGGSGIETHAHLKENGRLCIMFCALEGDPKILRLYGKGQAHQFGTARFEELRPEFPGITVPVRGVIELQVSRIQDSCGWAVPEFEYRGQRSRLLDHNARRTPEEFMERRLKSNATSIDGLPGLERPG